MNPFFVDGDYHIPIFAEYLKWFVSDYFTV